MDKKLETCSKIKYNNMLLKPCMVFKKKKAGVFLCLFQGSFLAFSKAFFLPFPRLWNPAVCCRLYMYNAFSKAKAFSKAFSKARPFPRHDYPFPRPEAFFKATSLFQGHWPFSRPPAFFKARNLLQGHKPFSRPEAFFKATSLFQGQKPFSRP